MTNTIISNKNYGIIMVLYLTKLYYYYGIISLILALDSVVYPAMRSVPEGGEVTMCYGARPNDLLLVYSGKDCDSGDSRYKETEIIIVETELFTILSPTSPTLLKKNS